MKVKFMKIPFFVTMIAVFLCRVYQFIFIKDTIARNHWDIIEISLFAISAISILIMAIFAFRPKGAIFSFRLGKSTLTGIIGILSGVAIIFDSFYKLFKYISEYRDIMHLFLGIFGIAAGIIFILMNKGFLKGKNLLEHKGLLYLLPVIWGIFRLLELFFLYYSTSNKIWSVPDEFAIIFLLLFLLNLARILSNMNQTKELVRLILCGLSSTIFIFTYTTLSLANQIIVNDRIDANFITLAMDIILAVYMILIINAVKLEKESNQNPVMDDTVEKQEPVVEAPKESENITMNQIDTLVDKIKSEDGVE